MAKLLKAESFISSLQDELKEKFKPYLPLKLASINAGGDFSSSVYVQQQQKMASSLGIQYQQVQCQGKEKDFIRVIKSLNADGSVKGIILQRPLPGGISYEKVVDFVSPEKDVEGITSVNAGKLCKGIKSVVPPTAMAAFFLVKSTGQELYGKKVVIVGHSDIVGKPLLHLFLNEMATVSICHLATFEKGQLKDFVSDADILCVAVGIPGLIKGDWIKKGSIVIDIGINKVKGKIAGDVEFDKARKAASYITPVPGGVGPLTCLFLFCNLLELVEV